MAKSQNLPPSPGPPQFEFLVIFLKGFIGFRGPFVFLVYYCLSLCSRGVPYFWLVLAVLEFRHIEHDEIRRLHRKERWTGQNGDGAGRQEAQRDRVQSELIRLFTSLKV